MKKITIDEGNTSVKLALFENNQMVFRESDVNLERVKELLSQCDRLIVSTVKKNTLFESLFSTYPNAMISSDIAVAATAFLFFLLYKQKTKKIKIFKYVLSLFLVGFSLSLPLYLYDHLDLN